MRAQLFTSLQKNRRILNKFVINFLTLLILTSCGPALIWNVRAQDLPGIIASGDTSYLKNLDLADTDLTEILQYGPGSAYFHAYLAREIGREDLYGPLLEVEWRKGEQPWRLISGEELAHYYIEAGRYAEAEDIATGLLAAEDAPRYKLLYIEAIYWQFRDTEVLAALDEFDSHNYRNLDDYSLRELELFRAVSSTRLAKTGWKDLILKFFIEQPPSYLHYRALRFIENGYGDEFSAGEMALLNAVVAVADRRYEDAVPVFENLLSSVENFPVRDLPIDAAYSAFRYGDSSRVGAALFERIAVNEAMTPASLSLYELREATALLYFDSGNYRKAEEYFKNALDSAREDKQKDRMRWYLLKIALIRSVDDALQLVSSTAQSLAQPAFYTDIFNSILTRLVDQRRWRDILDFYLHAGKTLDPETRARSAYLCSAAFREGFLDAADGDGLVASQAGSPRSAEILLGDALVDGGMYYGFLASRILGVLPAELIASNEPVEETGETTLNDLLVAGFISYGLADHAFALVQDDSDSVGDQTLLKLADVLSEAGDTYDSIRTMDILKSRPTFRQTREAFELLYPRTYRKEIEEAADRDGIPPYILFALIREESYFKPDIVSRSGAVGLSQLMPATAADTAHRMRIDLPPLTDPAGNISIGSHYFSQMLDRFIVPSNAVFAYNAGPTRMRMWRREYADLPEDLLLEALPIEETQDHGRKVFSSAVMYGYLYYGVMPAEIAAYYLSFTGEGTSDELY